MVGTANTPGMKTFNKNQTPRNGKSTGRIQPSSYARSIVVSTRYIFRMQVLGNNVGLLKSDFNPRC